MRRPDKPGTYRVVPRNGRFMLTGVRVDGSRLKVRDLSRVDAERMGAQIFGPPKASNGGTPVATTPPSVSAPAVSTAVDDWGLPIRVQAKDAANLNAALGIAPQPAISPIADTAEKEKQEKRAKNARSIMELAGVTWAAGSVWAGRKLCENTGREPVKPSSEQVKDLRDVTKETFTEWFGDHEVKPWQMMILLSVGIPLSMFLQSPRKKEDKLNLKVVP